METDSDLENKLVISIWEREVDRVKVGIGNQEAQTTVYETSYGNTANIL